LGMLESFKLAARQNREAAKGEPQPLLTAGKPS